MMNPIEFLDEPPRSRQRWTIGAIMALILGVALALTFIRGWELGCGVVAVWVAVVATLIESLARVTGRSRLRSAVIITIAYPWLALAVVSFLLAWCEANQPDPFVVETVSILVRAVLIGVPVALVANYYLILAEAYPIDDPGGPRSGPGSSLRPLVVASVVSWTLGVVSLLARLVMTH